MTEFKASKLENLIKVPQKIAKLVNLYAGDGDYSRRMFGEQFAYGHREILLKYCGLDFSTQIIGNLQHGVYGYKQKIDFRSPRFIGGKPSTFWVYSKMYEEIGKSLGHDNVTAIGAPWLYLRKSISEEMKSISTKNEILVMPSHSQSTYVSVSSAGEKRKRAKAFRDVIGPQQATVCLYAMDICDPEVVEAYFDEGFRITCIGSSIHHPSWSQSGNRIRSLNKLMTLMKSHRTLVTDSYGSHLLYGITMGMEIGVFPEIRKLSKVEEMYGKRMEDYEEVKELSNELEFFSIYMPESINNVYGSSSYLPIANEILGLESMMEPAELRSVLDYRKGIYPISQIQPW